jgi:hypothetical protein
MTMPPPPPPPGGGFQTGFGATTTPFIGMAVPSIIGSPKKSSLLPLILAILAVLLGSAVYGLRDTLAANEWFLVGYFLTPLLATLALGFDSLLRIKGQRNPWYSPRKFVSGVLRVVVIAGFAVGVLHIIELGRWLGESAVQGGWF